MGDKSRLHSGGRSGPYSPVIEIDDDSHSRFPTGGAGTEDQVRSGRGRNVDDIDDNEWKSEMYCQPRNSLLSITTEFLSKCSVKMQELNKKSGGGGGGGGQDKSHELLDNRCFMKLVDVAHGLLKMAPYDLECIKLPGLQAYMHKVFPLTDWSLETMRPSLITIIRRLDKLFTKIQKSGKVYRSVDWSAAAGLLKGIYLTLWKHPYIVNVPNMKSLIGTCQCLVVGDDSLTIPDNHHLLGGGATGSGRRGMDLPPEKFCTVVFQLVSLQVLILGETFTLEQRLQLNDQGTGRYNLLTSDKGESLMLNLLLPLCLKVGCGRKDAPKMRRNDVKFALNLLLNLLNPSTLYTRSAGPTSHKESLRVSSTSASGQAVQYNPAGDVGRGSAKVKTSSMQIAFLGIKIMIVCFERQLNSEWFRIARTIRDMGYRLLASNQQNGSLQEDSAPLWRFLDFIAAHRGPLYTLLLPFMHTRLQQVPICNRQRRT